MAQAAEQKLQAAADESDTDTSVDTLSPTEISNQVRAASVSATSGSEQQDKAEQLDQPTWKIVVTPAEVAASEEETFPEPNEDGVYKAQNEVDYAEPPDDAIHREFVNSTHWAEDELMSWPAPTMVSTTNAHCTDCERRCACCTKSNGTQSHTTLHALSRAVKNTSAALIYAALAPPHSLTGLSRCAVTGAVLRSGGMQ